MKKDILPVIIGTAGHVDHGKTTLVSLLTGCDTDRLKEEKERGLSIDLGFAPCSLQGNKLAGIVDVPGHEDFIKNMVAGAASIDILILVIAADDGIMPQTVEHLKIVSFLRSLHILVVVSKCDLIEPEMLEVVHEEIYTLLEKFDFSGSTVIDYSSKTLQGIKQIRETLEKLIENRQTVTDRRDFRMNIQHAFSVKGYGTVVTGIPVSGSAMIGDELELVSQQCSIRALENYKIPAQSTSSGACTALNLRNIDLSKIHRGLTLHAPGSYSSTKSFIATIKNIAANKSLKRLTRLRFHCGTFSCSASIKLIYTDSLMPNDEALVHIKLSLPTVLTTGDKFILRGLSPVNTVAGGTVLTLNQDRVNKRNTGLHNNLKKAVTAIEDNDFSRAAILSDRKFSYNKSDLQLLLNSSGIYLEEEINRLLSLKELLQIDKNNFLASSRINENSLFLKSKLSEYHNDNPYQLGLTPAAVCELFSLPISCFDNLTKAFRQSGLFKVNSSHYALKNFEPALSKQQIQLRQDILNAVEDDYSAPPARGELKDKIGATEKEMKLLTKILKDEGKILFIDKYIVAVEALELFEKKIRHLFTSIEVLDLKTWQNASGLSRNQAVGVLEYFDSVKLTRRTDNGRILCRGQN